MTATLNISEVRIDGKTQSRVEMNNEVITEYANAVQEGAEFPPIHVFFDGAVWWLADGFHRFHAHKQAGKDIIKAIVTQGTQRDAVLYSVGANASHGLRRTNADKRKAVMTLLEDSEWAGWSNREIARQCGVSDKFVAAVRDPITAKKQQKNRSDSALKGIEVRSDRIQEDEKVQSACAKTENLPAKETAPVVDEEKEKLKELLAQAQELNSELASKGHTPILGVCFHSFMGAVDNGPNHLKTLFVGKARFSRFGLLWDFPVATSQRKIAHTPLP
ncbi:hypothetical protein ACM5Q9_09645 [Advenella sp. RU8]|uniref:hypothetical protein n=1 Tax=Advenella sp. RU8 TaxID=3399575 RepID=UPI003AAEDAF2